MGANMSTVEESRAHVATPGATPMATFASHCHHSFKHCNSFRSQKRSPTPAPPPPPPTLVQPCMVGKTNNRIMTFHSKASWSGYLESSKAFTNLVVVYFTNKWYEPCRYMEPTFKEFVAKYTNVEFVKIDVDELHDLSRHYGVQETPTFVLIKRGKVVDKVVGASKGELQWNIEKHSA